MSQLVFDEATAERIEAIYRIRDAVQRRTSVRRALGVAPGERVLDVGCGPGFYCAELADEVGASGHVTGVDNSAAMLGLARRRCAGRENVALHDAPAVDLRVDDECYDAALCVQVLEYVEDAPAGLAELHRALRPGGRVLVWDIDWTTVSLHSRDQALTDRVLRAWDEHLAHPALPRVLAPLLRRAGFEDLRVQAYPLATMAFDPESYGGALVPFVAQFVAGRRGVSEDEAAAWLDDQRELGRRGEFWFACCQFCFTARRPE